MLITLSCRATICQSVAEVKLTGMALLGAVSHIFNIQFNFISRKYFLCCHIHSLKPGTPRFSEHVLKTGYDMISVEHVTVERVNILKIFNNHYGTDLKNTTLSCSGFKKLN